MSFINRPERLRMFDRHRPPVVIPIEERWGSTDEQAGEVPRSGSTNTTSSWREDRYAGGSRWR